MGPKAALRAPLVRPGGRGTLQLGWSAAHPSTRLALIRRRVKRTEDRIEPDGPCGGYINTIPLQIGRIQSTTEFVHPTRKARDAGG